MVILYITVTFSVSNFLFFFFLIVGRALHLHCQKDLRAVCCEQSFVVLPSSISVCVPALPFASPVHGTAVLWQVGCYTCWWCRSSISATTWQSARRVSPYERKLLAGPIGDSSSTLVSTLWVSVATGQSSWPWEKSVILRLPHQHTWCKKLECNTEKIKLACGCCSVCVQRMAAWLLSYQVNFASPHLLGSKSVKYLDWYPWLPAAIKLTLKHSDNSCKPPKRFIHSH